MVRRKSRKSGLRKLMGSICKVCAILFSVSLILSYVSMFINPEVSGVLVFLGLFFIPIFAGTLFFALVLILARSRWMLLPIMAMFPSLFLITRFYGFSPSEMPEKSNLSVLTYNIGQQGLAQVEMSYRECTDSIVNFVQDRDCDIVCLQEVYCPTDSSGLGKLFDRYPYRHYHLTNVSSTYGFGNMLISKYPIVNTGKLLFKGSTNQIIYADIQVGGDTLRVYDNHLQSTGVSFTSFVKNMYDRNKLTKEIEHMTGSLSRSFLKRSKQVDTLYRHAADAGHPVVICGDFNDTPTSYAYYMIKSGRKDTFQQAGHGFGATYSALWPLLRIDFIFVPEEAEVVSHQTFKVKYSDHYPVMSRFNL